MKKDLKVMAHGYGAMPQFLKHFINYSKRENPTIQWSIVLPDNYYEEAMKAQVGDANVLILNKELKKYKNKSHTNEKLYKYPGKFFRHLGADKHELRYTESEYQMWHGQSTLEIYDEFLKRQNPDILFIPNAETPESLILANLAREMGCEAVFQSTTRNLGESFFCVDQQHRLPPYAKPVDSDIERAKNFYADYKKNIAPALSFPCFTEKDGEFYPFEVDPLPMRAIKAVQRSFEFEDHIFPVTLGWQISKNLPIMRDGYRNFIESLNKKIHHIDDASKFPEKFIFMPLHHVPESSVSTPAPYFVDQIRAIDLIRFNMPNEMTLVVKEHPVSVMRRPLSFMRQIAKLPGVKIAHVDIPSNDLIEKSSLVMSIRGSANFEAILKNKPSLTFSDGFWTDVFETKVSLEDLDKRIENELTVTRSDEEIIYGIATIMNASHRFILYSPGDRLHGKMALHSKNIENCWNGLLEHVERMKEYRTNQEMPFPKSTNGSGVSQIEST